MTFPKQDSARILEGVERGAATNTLYTRNKYIKKAIGVLDERWKKKQHRVEYFSAPRDKSNIPQTRRRETVQINKKYIGQVERSSFQCKPRGTSAVTHECLDDINGFCHR